MTVDPLDRLSFAPLTPLSFLHRAGTVFADRLAVVDGALRLTYEELCARCERLAGALTAAGVGPGSRVAVLAPNTHTLLEAHFGVPWAGAALVAMNVRLTAAELAYIVDHADVDVLLYDHSFSDVVEEITKLANTDPRTVQAGGPADEYEAFVDAGQRFTLPVEEERSLLSLNYTSGTTGQPKGVRYHHRGAFLQAFAMAFHTRLQANSVFLWTLPMFHCNGWCFPWAVTAAGGAHLCLHDVDPTTIWQLIHDEGVTHFNAAPTVLTMLVNHPAAAPRPQGERIQVATGGAPPSPTLLAQMDQLGMEVIHLYGLTETFGPVVICDWKPEWNSLPSDEQARLKARQGVGNVASELVRVVDDKGDDVPADGTTMGEIAVRGNNVMLGYERDPDATQRAAPDGWFRTGDLGVLHPDGYVELRDRAKDIIVSGGENIPSVEVEQTIAAHPAVLEVAVVGAPDDVWGETPVAYVTLKEGASATEDEIVAFARQHLAHFKAPKQVAFGPQPKTSTGKIQKYVLRERARTARLGEVDRPTEAS